MILWVSTANVMFSFYEKDIVLVMVLHKRSAMPEEVRRATLDQELVQRMINTSQAVLIEDRLRIIDDYA